MKRFLASLLIILTIPSVLCAQRVGLVMSGGGARGLAHIGVIKMLEEKGCTDGDTVNIYDFEFEFVK